MHDTETQQRFIGLRAEGWSFARIAQELQISKPTLIKWSHKFQFEIQNQRAILLENLQDKWLSGCDARVNALGELLRKVEAELVKRDVASLPTGQLFRLAQSLRNEIKEEIGPMTFTTPIAQIPHDEYVEAVHDWKP